MQPSTSSFQKTARRSFEGGGAPGSLLLGQDPQAGQYGHAAIGAPVDQGAALDRKLLAASAPPAVVPGATGAFSEDKKAAGRGMLSAGNFNMPMPSFENGGQVSPLSLKGIGRSMGFFQTPAEKQAAAVAKIDAEQAAYHQRTAQAPTAPPPTSQQAATHSYTGNTSLSSRMAAAGLRNGGKIKGPGTGTSDSIPAQVEGSGEPIRVANGERIVSVAQDKLLQRIAKARGYDTVDHMFEAETGKPVGPVLKGGKLAAAGGASQEELQKRVAQIPAGGAAPAWDGSEGDGDFMRNVKNSAAALGPVAAGGSAGVRVLGLAGKALTSPTAAAVLPYAVPAAGTGALMAAASSPATADQTKANPAPVGQPATAAASGPVTQAKANPVPVKSDAPGEALVQGQNGRQYQNAVVSPGDHLKSDAMLNSVMGRRGSADEDYAARVARLENGTAGKDDWKIPPGGGVIATTNADLNIRKLALNPGAMDTANQAWAMRGAGVMASKDAKGGLVLSNSTAPEKMQYADRQGNPTSAYENTSQYDNGQKQLAAARASQAERERERQLNDLMNRPMNRSQRAAAVQMAQTASQDKRAGDANKIAQGQLDLATTDHAFKKDQTKQLQSAWDAYKNAKTPQEKAAAEEAFRLLSGHPGREVPDLWDKVQTGVDPVTNAPIYSLYNKRTGETKADTAQQKEQYAEGSISTVNGKSAKWVGGKWVPQ